MVNPSYNPILKSTKHLQKHLVQPHCERADKRNKMVATTTAT